MGPATINLGGTPYQIKPLTIAQLEVILPLIRSMDLMSASGLDAAITVISTATSRGTPALSRTQLVEIEGVTVQELQIAVEAVIALTGLEAPKKPQAVSESETAIPEAA